MALHTPPSGRGRLVAPDDEAHDGERTRFCVTNDACTQRESGANATPPKSVLKFCQQNAEAPRA
ncbi:hypothetical protein ACTMU2_27325 [Cupriavidus basilensis]